MKLRQPLHSRPGFTLIEVLVTITIIIVMATLAVVLFGRLSKSASSATMANNLRQIGTAIRLYADANNDKLPGPLHLGQRPIYRNSPQTHLAYHLRDHFFPGQVPREGQEIEVLASSMWRKETPALKGISLLSQQDVDPDPRVSRNPWGYAGASQDDPNRQPITQAKLASYDRLPWALIEADREHPLVGSAGWRAEMPGKPVHGKYRMAMNFDGSVVKRLLNEELTDNR
jgi:type II secretory pathway pseudopilin PulG